MRERLSDIIQYVAHGKQVEFAEMMGWTPQYVYRLLKGASGMGIRPVVAILEKFPEINARWLLLGEGAMVSPGVDEAKQHLFALLSLEKYMPVMSPDELHQLTSGRVDFPDSDIERWALLLEQRTKKTDDRFAAAYLRQSQTPSSVCSLPNPKS